MQNQYHLEQYPQQYQRDQWAEAEHERWLAACGGRLGVARQLARPLGQALLGLGNRLLSYANRHADLANMQVPTA